MSTTNKEYGSKTQKDRVIIKKFPLSPIINVDTIKFNYFQYHLVLQHLKHKAVQYLPQTNSLWLTYFQRTHSDERFLDTSRQLDLKQNFRTKLKCPIRLGKDSSRYTFSFHPCKYLVFFSNI